MAWFCCRSLRYPVCVKKRGMTKRCRSGHTFRKDADQSPYNHLEDVFPGWYSRFILGRRAPVFGLSPLLHQCGSRFRFPIAKNPFVSERGHHRICSKSYSKDSGMILRLDVAVERRRRARPVWRAALCGQHTALEQVTERIRGIIPILATRTDLRVQRKRCPTSCSPTSLRSAGTHRLQRRLRLAVRTAQTEVVGPAKAALRVPRCRLPYDLEQILR